MPPPIVSPSFTLLLGCSTRRDRRKIPVPPCALAAGGALLILVAARPARALDPFELQVYDGTANPQHVFGIELHLNRVATGHATADAPELPLRGQTHATLEPSFGLFPWWEIGGYFQTALRADGHVDYAGVKLRSKFVTPPSFHPHLRFGVNLEISILPQAYDRDRWGGEVRPIAAWEGGGWLFAVNPIIGIPLAGPGFAAGPSFEPAAKVAHRLAGVFAVGFEYYGSIGAIASPEPRQRQRHMLFGALDIGAFRKVEINLGLGGGLTSASAGLVGKVILGYTFEKEATGK